jgi:hypothetical protein
MTKDFNDFRKQLNELRNKGANIDPDKVIEELTKPVPEKVKEIYEDSFDRKAWKLMRRQINKLLDDFENFYGPKGRGLSVAIHVQKEGCADRYADHYPYIPDKLSIVHIVDIGSKKRYDKIDFEKDREWIEKHNKMVAEQRAKAEARGKDPNEV